MDYIEISAKTKDEAIIKASMELETPSDELDIKIISEGSSGFLGFGSKPAIIRARKKDASEIEAEKEVAKIREAADKVEEKVPAQEPVESIQEPVKPVVEKAPVEEKVVEEKVVEETVPEEKVQKSTARESRPVELITDQAVIEDIKKKATEFLASVFKTMGLEVEIKADYNTEDICLDIEFLGEDMGILIGKRGQTLDSLQYLTSLVVNKDKTNYVRVKLDTENYRNRRKTTLENLAKGIASKVRRNRKPVVLEPMNPYERRIIHSTLQNNRYVETVSEGEEPYRHVVVKLKGRR